jgi:hypothetical protein
MVLLAAAAKLSVISGSFHAAATGTAMRPVGE